MRKLAIILLLVLAVAVGINYIIKTKIGNVGPVIFPSQGVTQFFQSPQTSMNLSTHIQTGQKANFPFKLPPGFKIGLFSQGLTAPRDLEFSPQGTLLASIPSQGKVVALPDINGDGIADRVVNVLTDLNKPHGIAFYKNALYVAEETQVVRYKWDEGSLSVTRDKKLFDLPIGGNHVTRSIVFNMEGKLFITIGSTCNVCKESDPRYASVMISDNEGTNPHIFASGLRNSVFLTLNPFTDEIWAGDMGRDYLGDNVPPEEINIIRDGKDYGWPYCFDKKIHDNNFDPNNTHNCERTENPIYEIQAHSAALGVTFINSPQFPADWQGDLLVSYHGSSYRSVPTGYKIVHMKVNGNTITTSEDFLTGFISGSSALGRPVDVTFDKLGSLFVSDDKAGVIYKIIKSS